MVGNPNVGKSSLFYMLSGKYEEISNYPGTSVAVAIAKTHFGTLIDTPGIHSLTDNTQLEEITKKYVNEADLVMNVVNALTLERDLIFTKQLLETQCNLLLVVNQIDEAEKNGISIDYEQLSRMLGVKVVKTMANKGVGKHEMRRAMGESMKNSCHMHTCDSPDIKNILKGCLSTKNAVTGRMQKIDRLLLNPLLGWPILLCVLYVLFKLLGTVISGHLVDYLVEVIDRFYIPTVSSYVSALLGDNLLAKILTGEFGVLTMAVRMLFGIVLPLITGFHIIMSLLEDSGYIPRMAALAGRFFNFLGLNGDAIIPALLGFGCGAMGTISTRILGTTKEKIIATALIGLAIPCAAQQGIIISLLASLNKAGIFFVYIVVMLVVATTCGKILNLCLGGDISHFIMDIPPLRLPSFRSCFRKTMHRIKGFFFESIPLFALSAAVISVLHEYGTLHWLQSALAPIVENMLHLPKEFSDVFVMGIIGRDLASAKVFNMSQGLLSIDAQILTATVVISLFVPCINAILVIFKERGWQMAISLWFSTFLISIAVGAVLTRILELF
jgi:ferrous iron transport protein B